MFCRVRRSLWLSLTLLLILAILASWLSWRQYDFEKALHTLSIDFDDLPNDYANALMHSDHPQGDIRYDDSLLPEPDPNLHIPPIIHFIWYHDLYNEHLDVSLIPSTGSDAPDHCANVNTNFTIMIWNGTAARSFLEENYPWIMPTYNSYRHPIQRVDALKYFVLWHYGGVYMDLDISCRRSLRPLLPFPAWLPKATPFGKPIASQDATVRLRLRTYQATGRAGVNNDLMAARRHHPLIGQMTESLERRNKNLLFPYLTIFWATGPQFTSDMLKAYWLESGTGYVKGDNKSAASRSVFLRSHDAY